MSKISLKKIFILAAIIGLLIFLHKTNFLRPIENITFKTLEPFLVSFYKASAYLRNTFNTQTEKRDLGQLLKEKESEVNALLAENARLKSVEEENEILRQYLNFSKEEKKSFILSNIIFREGLASDDPEKSIVINRGTADGMREGSAVVDSQGIIIGKVTQTKDNTSEICLVTSGECKMAATLKRSSEIAGIIRGEHGLTIMMEFIPQTAEIKEGDIVATSGLEQNIPRGLVIGKVIKVDKESSELWQNIIIEPSANLDNLSIVAVLL